MSSDIPGQRYMAQDAANLCPEKRTVAFSTRPVGAYHRINWGRNWEDVDVDEIMTNKRTSKKQQAQKLLREWLANGPVLAEELKQLAQTQEISWRTLNDAKSGIGVVSFRPKDDATGAWKWKLPKP